ncbi:uncharacterized protein ACLA_024910 [Aspergillus clavatus NRRL 1]|uniref:DNA replication regulator Sld3 C-terminal domain-containing protein n=1 Tax=Aspergillus clavatus (strain ATCC 1007 / CBS 513.65 / DSM 816 / NCTC 3887 / NRRL 1 / QM 1276 / 107) TaxID=344612 RepID=A1CQ54_ASPCL|nr:uncharacterized protein ACLA_024910 [Aspergillus clavatus NRRL 1]EAW07775.1 conserved hypothetical protein [Aspergillus clavatus NRRL 1]
MASRGSSGVLETLSSASLNRIHDLSSSHPPLKKRKTYHAAAGELSRQTISIRAHAAALSDEPYLLEPIAVVPRSRVPFSWLDSPAASSQLQSGSLFVANVPVLEDGLQDRTEPCVLAVRLLSDGDLYIIERVKRGIYALSKLVRGVDEGDIFVAVKGWNPSACAQNGSCELPVGAGHGAEWWELARIDDPTADTPVPKRARFDVSLVFDQASVDVVGGGAKLASMDSRMHSMAPPSLALDLSCSSDVAVPFVLNGPQDNDGDVFGDIVARDDTQATEPPLSPQELLDAMRDQYLQALYISKTSVAYFAKGPLARCRAAFQPIESSSTSTGDLAGYYREAILAAKKMDLKYRETLPSTIRDVLLSISEDELKQARKRKSKKKKLGKNGLYPEEEGFVRKWWKDRVLTDNGFPAAESSREAELKKHVADLRLRETQLQVLLILETLALEATVTEEPKSSDTADQPLDAPKTKLKKKSQDLDVLLELHLDRLCIWHAVSTGDSVMADSARSFDSETGRKVESDAVRDFCTEVIIPFYASRLPDRCKVITRKLGVSGISPITKQSHTKKTSRGEAGKPVERSSTQRNPRRSLQRVLTDQQTASQKRQPSLGRSNTVPSQLDAKRESVEPLLPMLSTSVRGGIQKAKRAENREVDLNAVTRQHEAKLRKVQMLMEQKKELDAAINALRKPNRELVAKDIAEDADKRTSSGSSRKPKNPVRNPFGQGVQVMATPRGHRKKDALPALPRSLVRPSVSKNGSSPFGDPQVVPASVTRPSFLSKASAPGSLALPFDTNQHDHGAVQETPSRRPAPSMVLMDATEASPGIAKNLFRVPQRPEPRSTDSDIAPSTPVSRCIFSNPLPPAELKPSTVMETPPRPPSVPAFLMGTGPPASPAAILTTPVKGAAARLAVPTVSAVPVTPEKSIYAQLGWDEDELA